MFRRRRTQSAANSPGHSAHAVSRLQPVEDVYLLFLNRPPRRCPRGRRRGDRRDRGAGPSPAPGAVPPPGTRFEVSVPGVSERRRRDHRRPAPRHRAPAAGSTCFAVGLDRFEPALDDELDAVGRGRRRLQGGPRRVRLRQDLLRPLAGRAGQAPRLRHRRGADLRDRDAAAPAGDGLPAARRAARHRRRSRRRVPAGRRRAGSSPWRRTSSPTGRSPTTTPQALAAAVDALLEQRLAGDQPRHAPASPPALRGYRPAPRRRRRRHRRRAARLARRPAARRRRGQARRRGQGRPRPLRRPRLPAGPADRPARRRATPGWCSCSTRSRRCSGSAATSARRRSTRCASSIDEVDAGRFPGLYLRDHRHAGVLRRPAGRAAAAAAGPAAAHRLRRPTPASTTRGRSRSACPASTSDALVEVGAHGPRPLRRRRRGAASGSGRVVDDAYVARPRPAPSPATSAARSASPPGCS